MDVRQKPARFFGPAFCGVTVGLRWGYCVVTVGLWCGWLPGGGEEVVDQAGDVVDGEVGVGVSGVDEGGNLSIPVFLLRPPCSLLHTCFLMPIFCVTNGDKFAQIAQNK